MTAGSATSAAGAPRLPRRVCLVTTLQPSANPRVVKEADALVEAGCEVRVVAAHWADWADAFDDQLLRSRRWRCETVDWRLAADRPLFWKSRVRHYVARRIAANRVLEPLVETAALSRIAPELIAPAAREHADLFIAHNLGALPAALEAGRVHRAAVGFDAEDFHSGQLSRPEDRAQYRIVRAAERRLLPRCSYVTAAAPAIADAYATLCGIETPTCILNVFPLADRPTGYRSLSRDGRITLYWFSQTIGPDRGLEDAVRALGLLGRTDVELHLRGRWAAGYEQSLRRVAVAAGVEPARIIAHEPAEPGAMVCEAAAYDVGLAIEPPASVNNDLLLSNKVFTYLLAGTAVIATRTTGQSWLGESAAGAMQYCEAGRPDSFAAALRPWLENVDRLETARRCAWALGTTRFNWDREKTVFLDTVARTFGVRCRES